MKKLTMTAAAFAQQREDPLFSTPPKPHSSPREPRHSSLHHAGNPGSTRVGLMALVAGTVFGLAGAACIPQSDDAGLAAPDGVEQGEHALTTAEQQNLANAFYGWGNPIKVVVEMKESSWNSLRTEDPANGEYTWYEAPKVSVESPKATFAISSVGLKKKSVKGSKSSVKPSLNLDFARYPVGDGNKAARDTKETAAESKIGISRLMFNNGIQDHNSSDATITENEYVYVRQCLGYRLLQTAGLPYQRCNFVNVCVLDPDQKNTDGTKKQLFASTYVNVEPIEPRYAQNNFNGNKYGNMYEFAREKGADFVPETTVGKNGIIEWKGFSDKWNDGSDMNAAITAVNAASPNFSSVIDVTQLIKVWAMEILLKQWDGFSRRHNNTYVYNDIDVQHLSSAPSAAAGTIKFKFAMSGIDQILQYEGTYKNWELYEAQEGSNLISLILADTRTDYRTLVRRQIYTYLDTVFNATELRNTVIPNLRTLESAANALLTQVGKPLVPAGAVDKIVNTQLKSMRPAIDQKYEERGLYHITDSTWTSELLAGARQKNGALDVFHISPSSAIHHQVQTGANGLWNPEASFGGSASQIAATINDDSRLEVFYIRTSDNHIVHNWQTTANGSWSGEIDLCGPAKQFALAMNDDGRLELFYVRTDNLIYRTAQTAPNSGWSAETALAGAAKQLTVAKNLDGSLELFTIGTDDKLYHNYQVTPKGAWSGQVALGGTARQIVVGRNADGRLEVFYVTADNRIFHNYQLEPNSGWSGEQPFDGLAKQLAVGAGQQGRLELFYIGTNDRIYHNYQTTPNGGWSGEAPLAGMAKRIMVTRQADKRLELVYIGTNDLMYHNTQNTGAGWTGEFPM